MVTAIQRVSKAIVLDQLLSMEELAGPAAVKEGLSRIPEQARQEIQRLLPMGWCALASSSGLILEVATAAKRDRKEFYAAVVRRGVERTLSTVWRMVMRITTDGLLVNRTPMIYSKTYEKGAFTANITKPGVAEIVLSGWPDVPDLDVLSLSVAIETFLTLAGRKEVRITTGPHPDGARFDVTWK